MTLPPSFRPLLVVIGALLGAGVACPGAPGADAGARDDGGPYEDDGGPPGDGGAGHDGGGDGDAGAPDAADLPALAFAPLPVPLTDDEKRTVRVTDTVLLDGTPAPLGAHQIIRGGATPGGAAVPFAALTDVDGSALTTAGGAVIVSDRVDFTSVFDHPTGVIALSHVEACPGGLFLTRVAVDDDGALSATATAPVDTSSVGGLWTPCAGSITPWGTHLGAEEYPPDAKLDHAASTPAALTPDTRSMLRYWGLDAADPSTTMDDVDAVYSPYRYGFPFEASLDAEGAASVVKHPAMGRLAGELAIVMPDARTAYITDDATKGVLLLFVADQVGDLSSGALYAMRWNQSSDSDGGRATLDWIALGHATDDEVRAAVDAGVRFSDLLDVVGPVNPTLGTCPGGYSSIHVEGGLECARIVPGQEALASRLETRRVAALLGATTELRKEEGAAFDPLTSTLYLAITTIDRAMTEDSAYDVGGPDHIRLPPNPCGVVYALSLDVDVAMGSDYVARSLRGAVVGRAATYPPGDPLAANTCDVDGIAGPDNLGFIPGARTLLIAEDTGSKENAALWAYHVEDRTLTRVLTAPLVAEVTGALFVSSLVGRGYVMSVIQHPLTGVAGVSSDLRQASVWALGPLPAGY